MCGLSLPGLLHGHTPSVVALHRNSSRRSPRQRQSVAGNLHGVWRGGGLSLPGLLVTHIPSVVALHRNSPRRSPRQRQWRGTSTGPWRGVCVAFLCHVAGHTPSVVALYRNSSRCSPRPLSVAGNLHGFGEGVWVSFLCQGCWSHTLQALWRCIETVPVVRHDSVSGGEPPRGLERGFVRPFSARVAGHTPSAMALYRNSSRRSPRQLSVAGNLHGACRGGV